MLERRELANLWRSILRTDPTSLFDAAAERLEARQGLADELAQPGLVGPEYETGGVLFVGKNPGKGGSSISTGDRMQYELLRALRDATDSELAERFNFLNEALADRVMPSWALVQKYIRPTIAFAGLSLRAVEYINLLKWRSEQVNGQLLRDSWLAHTGPQYRALRPGFVVVLGKTTFDPFVRHLECFDEPRPTRCEWIKRRRRDSQDPDAEAQEQIARIAADLSQFLGSPPA